MARSIKCDICSKEVQCQGFSDEIDQRIENTMPLNVTTPLGAEANLYLYIQATTLSGRKDLCDDCVTMFQREAWVALQKFMKRAELEDGKDWIFVR